MGRWGWHSFDFSKWTFERKQWRRNATNKQSNNILDDSEHDMTDEDEDDLQQPPSNESVSNLLSILRLFLKTNDHTTLFCIML